MTSHPSRSYTLKTSSARPTPCVPSTAIVRTLCVATAISRPRARARFLVLLCHRRRLSALPRRLRLRAKIFLLSATISFFLLPYPRFCLVFCSRDVGSAVPPRVAPSIFRLRGESGAYSQAPLLPPAFRGGAALYCTVLYCTVLYASFDVMAIGTNSLTCGFNRQCTADAIGYVVMITARLDSLPSPQSLPRLVWVHLDRQAAGVVSYYSAASVPDIGKKRLSSEGRILPLSVIRTDYRVVIVN